MPTPQNPFTILLLNLNPANPSANPSANPIANPYAPEMLTYVAFSASRPPKCLRTHNLTLFAAEMLIYVTFNAFASYC